MVREKRVVRTERCLVDCAGTFEKWLGLVMLALLPVRVPMRAARTHLQLEEFGEIVEVDLELKLVMIKGLLVDLDSTF